MMLFSAAKSVAKRPSRVHLIASLLLSVGAVASPALAAPIDKVLDTKKELSIFAEALRQSGLWERTATEASVTMFVPSDRAMRNEGSAFLLEKVLITNSNHQRLTDVMSHHVVFGSNLAPDDITGSLELKTGPNSCLSVFKAGSGTRVGPEAVVTDHIVADNGVIYVIDRLLWEPWDATSTCTEPSGLVATSGESPASGAIATVSSVD